MDIRKIFEYALQREREGKRFFEESAARLSHAAASGAFLHLAGEEQKHIVFISEQLSRLERGVELQTRPTSALGSVDYFDQRAASEGIDQSAIESMVPDLAVLRMAYLIERDFAEFYDMAAKRVEGNAHNALIMLANWERGHERYFKDLHDRAFEAYANMPWGG